ncbi:MAG: MarR family transcriptional regulator [Dehalococcoidales bacterium]|nr:MarR family transcriptional regulator [Dehalococcoidales bacterium]
MDKKEVMNEIMELQRRMSQVIIPYAIASWRELDVPLAQLKSLLIIAGKGETNFSTLAQDLRVTPGNVTGIIERLVEQGLVSRKPSPEDRRIIWLQATDKGRDLLANLMESQTRHMARILEYMSLEDLKSLLRGLSGFIHAVGEHQKEFN